MAKPKKRVGKGKAKRSGKAARRKPAARGRAAPRKPAAAASPALRPIVIPGAWPFPMGSKS